MSETVNPVVHEIWRPTNENGLNGKKVAVVGYSHYLGENESDQPHFTRRVVEKVISGDWPLSFFKRIRDAFGYDEHAEFWSRVYFFNFLPRSVGTKEKMYAVGTEDDIKEAQERFLAFLKQEQPDKVFVFTRKGWKQFPQSVEEDQKNVCNVLLDGSKTNWGTYQAGSKVVQVCGFQHPQYARSETLEEEVQKFLDL